MSQTKAGPDEVILEQTEAAPYYGVLVPEERYRFYQDTVKECAYKDSHRTTCSEDPEFFKVVPWFITGAVLGFLGGLVVR